MNEIQNIETKVENGGTTPQGRVSAAEFNIITDAAKRFDVSKYGAARISEGGQLQFFADAASMASYEADPQTKPRCFSSLSRCRPRISTSRASSTRRSFTDTSRRSISVHPRSRNM